MARQKLTPRQFGILLDLIHVVLGLAVIIMAVLAISDPEGKKTLFPIIFVLAAVINIVTSAFQFKMFPRDRKKQISGWIYLLTGILMLILFVISAISIW